MGDIVQTRSTQWQYYAKMEANISTNINPMVADTNDSKKQKHYFLSGLIQEANGRGSVRLTQ